MAHIVKWATLLKGGAFLALFLLTSACGVGETPTRGPVVSPTPTPPPSATATVTPTSVPLVSAVEAAAGVKIISGLGPTPTPRPTATPTPDLNLVQAQAATPAPTPTQTPTPWGLELVGVALSEESESPLAGVYVHGSYAYVGGMSVGYRSNTNVGIRIVDLTDPANPELVSRIPLRRLGYFANHTHGDAVATRIDSDAFQGDVAIILNGVPDSFGPESYPMPYGVWDVTDPSEPKFLSAFQVGQWAPPLEPGNLGDKPNPMKAVAGNYFFTVYDTTERTRGGDWGNPDHHMAVVDLSDPRNPVVVAEWQDTNRATMQTLSLNKSATRVYIAGVTPPPYGRSTTHLALYVLDISNPERPVEIARYLHPVSGGGIYTARAVPNEDDSLVILADGRWGTKRSGCNPPHGILHILDTSDLESIHEVSTFELPESSSCDPQSREFFQANDLAVRDNLVYSVWLNGGLHVVDISDPANPVEVGAFRSPNSLNPWLSDVALYGDHVLATTVWGSGMYILR